MSIAKKLGQLLNSVNIKTACTHLDLNSAIQTLCDGYSGSTGAYTPANQIVGSCKSLNGLRQVLYKANAKTGTNHPDISRAIQSLSQAYSPQIPLYSFAVVSDIHLQYATGQRDFSRALAYFDIKNLPFTMVCGDLTWAATMVNADKYTKEWKGGLEDYKDLKGNRKLYACGGNHETYTATYNEENGSWTSASTGFNVELWQECTGNPAYYTVSSQANNTVTHNVYNATIPDSDIFVMLSIKQATAPNLWLEGEWEWLQATLEANKTKRCFLFFHMHDNCNKTADPYGLYPYGISESTEQGKAFINLLRQYKNVIWFHGHTHTTFLEEHPPISTRHARGYRSVNVPSLQGPRKWLPETGGFTGTSGDSESMIVDVYPHRIVIRCLDMSTVNDKGTGEATELERYSIATMN